MVAWFDQAWLAVRWRDSVEGRLPQPKKARKKTVTITGTPLVKTFLKKSRQAEFISMTDTGIENHCPLHP